MGAFRGHPGLGLKSGPGWERGLHPHVWEIFSKDTPALADFLYGLTTVETTVMLSVKDNFCPLLPSPLPSPWPCSPPVVPFPSSGLEPEWGRRRSPQPGLREVPGNLVTFILSHLRPNLLLLPHSVRATAAVTRPILQEASQQPLTPTSSLCPAAVESIAPTHCLHHHPPPLTSET